MLSGQGGLPDVVGPVAIEETSNVALVRGLRRWWESKQTTAKYAAIARWNGPGAFVASWSTHPGGNVSQRLVVMPWADFCELVGRREELQASEREKTASEEAV